MCSEFQVFSKMIKIALQRSSYNRKFEVDFSNLLPYVLLRCRYKGERYVEMMSFKHNNGYKTSTYSPHGTGT